MKGEDRVLRDMLIYIFFGIFGAIIGGVASYFTDGTLGLALLGVIFGEIFAMFLTQASKKQD